MVHRGDSDDIIKECTMADYLSPNQLTLEVGKPVRVNLLSIARASIQAGAPFVYQRGIEDRLVFEVHDAVTEEELWDSVHVDVEGRDLVLTARNTTHVLVRVRFWDFDTPNNVVILTCAIIPGRRGTMPVPVNEETGEPPEDATPPLPGGDSLRIADMRAWGVGDLIALPTAVSPFFDSAPPTPVVDANDLDPAVEVVVGQNTLRVLKHVAAGSRGTAVGYGNYTFRIIPVAPILPAFSADAPTNLSADIVHCAPGAQITILPSSILAAIPAEWKANLALGNMTFEIRQGIGAPCAVVTGTGNTYPRLVLGTTAANMPARNNSITVAIKNTSTDTVHYALRFYFKVLRPDGTDPQNIPPAFVSVAGAENAPPAQTPLYRNTVYPPPLREGVLVLRRYEGALPDRLPQENIAIIAGKIEQEGTETTLGMGDARRVESIVPEILTGGIYDVPKSLSDDFWVEWPHPLPQEEG